MADMLVIVSKSVFDRARDTSGRTLRVGSVFATAAYESANPLLARHLVGGDLYLVTARGQALWLVGVLRSPKRTRGAWRSSANTQPIVDITKLAPRLVFESGKGIAMDRPAMSLQTPKVLTAADVRLLGGVLGGGGPPPAKAPPDSEPDRVDRAVIDAAVVHVLAELLGRSEADIRGDGGRYAAFHQDDSAYDLEPGRIDWETLTLTQGDEHDDDDDDDDADYDDDDDADYDDQIFGRMDFDFGRTRFEHESFRPGVNTDKSLRRLLAEQEGALHGAQIRTLVAQGRIDPDRLAELTFDGRIQAKGESLVDAARALFMLDTFDAAPLGPGEFSETHPAWQKKLAAVEPGALREHLAVFFQTAEAARCTGACVDPRRRAANRAQESGAKGDERIASWSIGEGQGACYLARIHDDAIPEVPPFEGYLIVRKRKPSRGVAAPRGKAAQTGADLVALLARHRKVRIPYTDGLATIGDVHALLAKVGPKRFFAPLAASKPEARYSRLCLLLNAAKGLLAGGRPDAALALLAAARPCVPDSLVTRVLYNTGVALTALGRPAEALELYREAATLEPRSESWAKLAPSLLHNNIAWCSYLTGDLRTAERHAAAAIAADPDNLAAHGTAGSIAYARGDTEKALEFFAHALANGHDPDPGLEVARLPRYRELAARHGVAVELSDEEAAALGPEAWVYEEKVK
ncbi:MAG: tetratricopeptide repeat protein [Myxococcales bacterium]|nr:tetratricopeptide repeat protein [Myxococcales bacterium]